LDGIDDEDEQKPEDIQRFIKQFKQWNLDKLESQDTCTQRNSSSSKATSKKDHIMKPEGEINLFSDE